MDRRGRTSSHCQLEGARARVPGVQAALGLEVEVEVHDRLRRALRACAKGLEQPDERIRNLWRLLRATPWPEPGHDYQPVRPPGDDVRLEGERIQPRRSRARAPRHRRRRRVSASRSPPRPGRVSSRSATSKSGIVSRVGPPKSSYTGTPSAFTLRWVRAFSRYRPSAFAITKPGLCRVCRVEIPVDPLDGAADRAPGDDTVLGPRRFPPGRAVSRASR